MYSVPRSQEGMPSRMRNFSDGELTATLVKFYVDNVKTALFHLICSALFFFPRASLGSFVSRDQ